VLTATVLALTAAVLHAGWNLAVKQTGHERFVALWAQFGFGGLIAAGAFLLTGGMAAVGWKWAVLSGCIHLPYMILLALAYGHGDFSQVYPIARGGGALLAAIGGVVLLDDHLSAWGIISICTIALGLALLAGRARGPAVVIAAGVAMTIGAYTLSDSKGSRVTDKLGYSFATAMMTAVTVSVYGMATGRTAVLRAALRVDWRRFLLSGVASLVTYTLVLVAVRYAPVGYVTALRESSVVIASLLGWRMLGEQDSARRVSASIVVLVGLVLLVTVGR
jgi:uncharacterized membrane protein